MTCYQNLVIKACYKIFFLIMIKLEKLFKPHLSQIIKKY